MHSNRERSVPSYRRHRQSGQAIVTLTDGLGNRRDVLLGQFGTKASRIEYARIIAEWEANGRRLPTSAKTDLSVAELIEAYWPFVEKHYRLADGTQTKEVKDFKLSLRPVNHLYGATAATEFGPLALKAVRSLLIDGYDHPKFGKQPSLSRGVVNQRVGRVRRMFRWATENELLPPAIYQGLLSVRDLQRGRSEARETEPVLPVARAVVEETLPFLGPIVADMVQLQLETGMRPGELVIMRACDIEMPGKVWFYRPSRHKTEHHGHGRTVPIGPRGQAIVLRHLTTSTQAFLFSPEASVSEFRATQRQARKTKVPPSQRCRRKSKPKKQAGERYTVCSFCRAVYAACDKAFPPPDRLIPRKLESGKVETKKALWARLTAADKAELKQWRKARRWHPHQLRHTRAMELKREAGLDVARAVLGHRSPVMTEHYATLDVANAAEVMAKIG